ncbi:MAG: RNA polymerase sigma factor [Microgenomates group bacterium]
MDMTDEVIIRQIQQGNIEVFETLVNRYSGKIKSYVIGRLFKKEEADDIVQISFIQLYKSISRFNPSRPLYPYLMQITRNELYMYFRKYKKTIPLNEELDYPNEADKYEDDNGDMLNNLRPDQKNALSWFVEGYSYKEISKKIGKPINTVRTLIRRARLFIQKEHSL